MQDLFNTHMLKSFIIVSLIITCPLSKTTTYTKSTVKPDYNELSKDYYTDIDYEAFTTLRANAIRYDQLVKEHYLEEMFPELAQPTCGDEACSTVMYEVSNHNLGEEAVQSLPTLLIIGGMHGAETLGIQGVMQFLKVIQTLYKSNSGIFQMLNNARLLLIPVLNMSGFYENTDFETVKEGNREYKVDPNFDFNLSPKDKCFTSVSSQYLLRIYQEYLIFGTLLLTRGAYTVLFPRLPRLLGISKETQENDLYNRIGGQMARAFHNEKFKDAEEIFDSLFDDDENDIPSMSLHPIASHKISDFLGKPTSGAYIDWAFAGSEEIKLISTECLPKGTPLKKDQIIPSDNSNRAMTFEVGISKEKLNDLSTMLGNEIGCVDMTHPDAKYGVIPGLYRTFLKFINSMASFVSLRKLEVVSGLQSSEGIEQEQINFHFEIYGTFTFFNIDLKHEGVSKQEIEHEATEVSILRRTSRILKTTWEGKNILKRDKNHDFKFLMDVQKDLEAVKKKQSLSLTHFLRSKLNLQYAKTLKRQKLSDVQLRNYSILNADLDRLDLLFYYEQQGTFGRFFDHDSLFVQIGPYFPLKLFYDKNTYFVKTEIIPSNIPNLPNPKDKQTDYSYEFGIVNLIKNGEKSDVLMSKINALKQTKNLTKTQVFNDEVSYVCMQLQSNGFKSIMNSLGDLDEKALQKIDKKIDVYNLESDKTAIVESDRYQNMYELCQPYFSENVTENIKKTLYFEMNEQKQILPSVFYNLSGMKLNVQFEVPEALKGQKQLDSGNQKMKKIIMNGTVIPVDPPITQTIDSESLNILPPAKDIIKIPYKNYMPFPKNKLTCGSTAFYFPVTPENLQSTAVKKFNANYLRYEHFYYITMENLNEGNNMVQIKLFTNTTNKTNEFILRNKNQSFVLSKTNKNDISLMVNESNRKKLKIYKGKFSKFDAELEGMYIMLFKKDRDDPSFDCFMADNTIGRMDAMSHFKIYLSLMREVDEIIKDTFAEEIEIRNKKSIKLIVPIICFVFVLIGAIGGALFYFFVMKKEKDGVEEKKEDSGKDEHALDMEA